MDLKFADEPAIEPTSGLPVPRPAHPVQSHLAARRVTVHSATERPPFNGPTDADGNRFSRSYSEVGQRSAR